MPGVCMNNCFLNRCLTWILCMNKGLRYIDSLNNQEANG
jgi:hypothetical protein